MPKIRVDKQHSLSAEDVIQRVDDYLVKLRDEKMKSMDFNFDWNGDQSKASIKGKGFKGEVTLAGNKVGIFLDLSMMLTPFKGKVEESMKRGLDKYLS